MKNLEREERSFIFIFIVIVIFTVALRYCFWFTSVLSTALDSISLREPGNEKASVFALVLELDTMIGRYERY